MTLLLASVTFSTASALILIALCFSSLIIALYCALFMVPVKRFMAKISSLGGGMKGLEAHLYGLKSETDSRIAAVEQTLTGQVKKLQEEIALLRSEAERARTEALEAGERGQALAGRVGVLAQGLTGLEGELRSLTGGLRESIRKQISDGYQSMESTVLGALDAVRDEIVRETEKLGSLRRTGQGNHRFVDHPPRDPRHRPAGKIISAEPLFAEMEARGEDSEVSPVESEEKAEKGEKKQPASLKASVHMTPGKPSHKAARPAHRPGSSRTASPAGRRDQSSK